MSLIPGRFKASEVAALSAAAAEREAAEAAEEANLAHPPGQITHPETPRVSGSERPAEPAGPPPATVSSQAGKVVLFFVYFSMKTASN